MTRQSAFAWFVVAVLSSGCERIDCELIFIAAIEVEIRDATSGNPIAIGSTVVAVDGAYRDSVIATSPPLSASAATVIVADARPGTYVVTVRRQGYRAWTSTAFHVNGDHCGPDETVHLQALLERE